MNIDLTPLSANHARTLRSAPLIRMLAISLALHVGCAALFLLAPRGGAVPSPFTGLVVELGSLMAPAPAMVEPSPTTSPVIPEQLDMPREDPLTPTTDLAPANPAVEAAPVADVPQELPRSSFGIGLASGSFASIGEGASLHLELKEYYLDLLRRLNERWWQEATPSTGRLGSAVVLVVVARSGEIVHHRLVRSSGNPAIDRALLRSIAAASPLPSLPDSYQADFFEAPLRFTPPLSLLSLPGMG